MVCQSVLVYYQPLLQDLQSSLFDEVPWDIDELLDLFRHGFAEFLTLELGDAGRFLLEGEGSPVPGLQESGL